MPDGAQHAIDPPFAKTSGHQDSVICRKLLRDGLVQQSFGLDPFHLNTKLVGQATMVEGFVEALV